MKMYSKKSPRTSTDSSKGTVTFEQRPTWRHANLVCRCFWFSIFVTQWASAVFTRGKQTSQKALNLGLKPKFQTLFPPCRLGLPNKESSQCQCYCLFACLGVFFLLLCAGSWSGKKVPSRTVLSSVGFGMAAQQCRMLKN